MIIPEAPESSKAFMVFGCGFPRLVLRRAKTIALLCSDLCHFCGFGWPTITLQRLLVLKALIHSSNDISVSLVLGPVFYS